MSWRLLVPLLLTGLLAGGIVGGARFEQLDDHRPLCVSCHHGTVGLTRVDPARAPHSTDFDAECHACHVLPVREYLSYAFQAWGLDPPQAVLDMENPTIDGQTCKECHLSRGRGLLPCERCHRDLETTVSLDEHCEACHFWRPLHPHQDQPCKDCHVETFLSHEDVVVEVMADKVAHRLPPPLTRPPEEHEEPRAPMPKGGEH